jgi:hypothetical protein
MQIAEDHAVDHDKGRIVTGSYRAMAAARYECRKGYGDVIVFA